MKNLIEFEIKKNLTNGICLSGSNISSMKHLLTKKYISKKELKLLINKQTEFLQRIETSKNEVLSILKNL